MDTKSELTAKLAQAKQDNNIIIVRMAKEIEAIEKQIADSDVTLKHGDYGHDSFSGRHAPADARVFLNGHHYGCYGRDCDGSPLEFVVGNIFDDLKKLKK